MLFGLLLGAACGSEGPQGAQGPQGDPGPNMIVAMGKIELDGDISSNYNIESCEWNDTYERWEITFNGFDYEYDFITIITAYGASVYATYGYGNGDLYVLLCDDSGNKVQEGFSFVVLETP